MRKIVVFVFAFISIAHVSYATSTPKIKLVSKSELPPFVYPLAISPSVLLVSDAKTFTSLASQVESHLDKVLDIYEIADKSTMRELLSAKLQVQDLRGDFKNALNTLEQVRALEEKPAAKLLSGLRSKARYEASVETGTTSGAKFISSFKKRYESLLTPLPFSVVEDAVKDLYGSLKTRAYKGVLIGEIQSALDPVVAKSGALDDEQVFSLIETRVQLDSVLVLKAATLEVLKAYIGKNNVPKREIWAAREVTLKAAQKLTPVLIAISDTWVDLPVFKDQVFTDPQPIASGAHGIAFEDNGNPGRSWLVPLSKAGRAAYPEYLRDLKAHYDIGHDIDSPEARALQNRLERFTPEEMRKETDFRLKEFHANSYLHGTHCAGIAVRGNPAARLLISGFNDALANLPFAPTLQWALRMKAAFMAMSEYYKSRNVRVVNMSWGGGVDEFESWLSKTGQGGDAKERKKRAVEIFAIWRAAIEDSIKNAPNTIFITAAGNSDGDASFSDEVPPSLRQPNLIVVGAVNEAGDETSFSSAGSTVAVYANGFEVESFVPGGTRVHMSGTSMAAPNVANLAGKLFALDPKLTPTQVIRLIVDGATKSEDGRRLLLNPKRSVEMLRLPKQTL